MPVTGMTAAQPEYFVVNFSNGTPKPEALSNLKFVQTGNQKCPIIVKTGNVEFYSEIINVTHSNCIVCKTDPISDTVHVSVAKVLLMTPKTKALSSNKKQENLSYVEKNLRLVEEFGSNKMKRIERSRKRKIDTTSATASAIKQNIDALPKNIEKSVLEEPQIVNNEVFPQKNEHAVNVEEIYNINDLIPVQLHDTLFPLLEEFFGYCQEILCSSDSDLPVFIVGLLKQNALVPSDRSRCLQCIYWYYLYTFYNQMASLKHWRFARKNQMIKNIPSFVRKHFKSTFLLYENFSNLMKIKCCAHLLVLALFLSNFHLDCFELLTDLDMKLPKLKALLKKLGCVLEHQPKDCTQDEDGLDNSALSGHPAAPTARLVLHR